ncbi:hypothetical protein ACGE24_08405 [Corynebacterium kroppenstedtii]|uniref:hypothetical protein n=1 Tax=Corynebacterium sp. PCR 32 TaxID=3351342 RepID=UPI0030AE096F
MGDFFIVVACVGPIIIGLLWRWPWNSLTTTRPDPATPTTTFEVYPRDHAYPAPVFLAVLQRTVGTPITLTSTSLTGTRLLAAHTTHGQNHIDTTWRLFVDLPSTDAASTMAFARSCGWQAWPSRTVGEQPGWKGYLREVRLPQPTGTQRTTIATGSPALPDSFGRIAITSNDAPSGSGHPPQCRAAQQIADHVRKSGRRVAVITDTPGSWVSSPFDIIVCPHRQDDAHSTPDAAINDAIPEQTSTPDTNHLRRTTDLEIWDCADTSITWATTQTTAGTILDVIRESTSQRWREARTVIDADDIMPLVEAPHSPGLLRTSS